MQLVYKKTKDPFDSSIHPLKEMAAYEALWEEKNTNFKKIAEIFSKYPGVRPSDLVSKSKIEFYQSFIQELIKKKLPDSRLNFLINSTLDYPKKLRDAKEPIEVLYYMGDLTLLNTRSVAIVGTRNPSMEGLARTRKLVRLLLEDDFTIVSGLAKGIDTEAHNTAIHEGGRTISVIGTPLSDTYPKQNKELQQKISKEHLLVSQVPFWKYLQQDYRRNRLFFPERNKTMSALTEATVIIEAGETSGTLTQARAALYQKRKLFILESCFHNRSITWPARFEQQGAIRVKEYEDIKKALK